MPPAGARPPSAEEWEAHKPTLQRLRHEGTILEGIMKHMESEYGFVASKNQYQRKFKEPQWNFAKNVNRESWEYILCKAAKRQHIEKPTQVTLFGQEVPEKKIKKARYQFTIVELKRIQNLSPAPPTPEGISVHTPLTGGPSNTERSSVTVFIPGPAAPIPKAVQEDLVGDTEDDAMVLVLNRPYNEAQSNRALCLVRKRQIPYLRCLDFLDLLDFDGNPLFRLDFFDVTLSDSWDSFTSVDNFDTECESTFLSENTPSETSVQRSNEGRNTQIIRSFAPLLVGEPVLSIKAGKTIIADSLEELKIFEERVLDKLANMPERAPGERELTIDALLGPPHPTAGLHLIRSVIYLSSNNLMPSRFLIWNEDMPWVVDNFPIQNMETLLQNDSPMFQAFRYQLLRFGVHSRREKLVKDLLHTDDGLKEFALCSTNLLTETIRSNNVEMMDLLLKIGLDVLKPENIESMKRSLLRECQSTSMLTLLSKEVAITVSQDSMVQSFDDSVLSPAVGRRDTELVRFLINAGTKINAIAVACAVSTGQSDILRLLVESEPEYHREPISFTKLFRLPDIDEGSLTPPGGTLIGTVLQAAAARGDTEMVRMLLESGSNINEPPYGSGGATPLQAAVESECVETVTFLLEHGADVNAPAIDPGLPRTALFTAIEIKNLDLIKVLLTFGADVCAPTLSPIAEKLAAVIQAAKLRDSYSDIVEALKPAAAEATNYSSVARSKRIQLCHAIQGGDVAIVRHLIILGACVDIKPVEEACWLELPGDDISSKRVGSSGGVSGQRIKYYNARLTDARATMLHMAITSPTIVDSSMFIYLYQQIDRPREQRWASGLEPPLHTAVRWRRFAIVEFLLKDGVNVDYFALSAPRFESTALNLAVQANDIEMILLLLEGGADINLGRSDWEESPLQSSLKRKGGLRRDLDFKVAKLLLSRGAIVHRPSSEDEETPLVMASENGNLDIIRMILAQGAPINHHWGFNMAPLMAAVKGGHLEAVEFLLDNGADANTPFPDDCWSSDRGTALQFAVINGSFAIAQLLLQKGANVNAVGPHSTLYGRTSLETAAIHGRLDIMQLCLNAGADSHLPPKTRYASALKIAKGDCFAPNFGVLKLLQEYREEALDEWNSTRILELEF